MMADGRLDVTPLIAIASLRRGARRPMSSVHGAGPVLGMLLEYLQTTRSTALMSQNVALARNGLRAASGQAGGWCSSGRATTPRGY